MVGQKKPDGGLRPLAIGNIFRRLSPKSACYHNFESRKARCGISQVGVGCKRGAELSSYVFLFLSASPQSKGNIILNTDFGNAFNYVYSPSDFKKPEKYNLKVRIVHTDPTVRQVLFFTVK